MPQLLNRETFEYAAFEFNRSQQLLLEESVC